MADTKPTATIGLLWQNDPGSSDNASRSPERFDPLVAAFRTLDVAVEPVLYSAETIPAVRDQLLGLDGVVVWVNPVEGGVTRAPLDSLLREVAAEGLWVSTHPEVILKMGTKEVLFRTRTLGWGSDTDLYRSVGELRERFAGRLRSEGVRVLKQGRGNGGNGVWRVELPVSGPTAGEGLEPDTILHVQQARRDAATEEISFEEFLQRCGEYFSWAGFVVDQPYQDRLAEGMIRCYLVHDEVVGFCRQWPTGLLPSAPPAGKPRPTSQMEGPDGPEYQALRDQMETEWVPQMLRILDLDTDSMPVIWDADFFYGPKSESGEDSYVLCEINVSAVWPFPPQATERLAAAATARILANRATRS